MIEFTPPEWNQLLSGDNNWSVDTSWRCVVCYELAQCFCHDCTLCTKHAREYEFGYGKTMLQMLEEQKEVN